MKNLKTFLFLQRVVQQKESLKIIDENNTNCNTVAAKASSILLQTNESLVENPSNKKQIKMKVLFNQGSQRNYLTKKFKNFYLGNLLQQRIYEFLH